MRKYFSTTALIAVLICTALPMAAATPTEFYANLLRRGIAAYDAGRFDEAAQHLRFAAFGSVDAIEAYQTAQTYLALTHTRLGEPDRAREAVRRVYNAERIDRRFARVNLPAAVRTAFDKLAAGVLNAAELAALRGSGELPPAPTPAPLRTTVVGTTPQTTPAQSTQPQTAAPQTQTTGGTPSTATPAGTATTTPTTTTRTAPPAIVDRIDVEVARPAATQTPERTQTPATTERPRTPATSTPASQTPARTPAQQPSTSATTPAAQNTPRTPPTPGAQTPRPAAAPSTATATTSATPRNTTNAPASQPASAYSASEVASRFTSAERALVSSNLPEARRAYRELLANPASADHATAIRIAEGLYRARDFAGALAAFERAGALRRGEEPYRYYVAVALYETGQYDRARRELAAALPYIEVTADVERYRLKIQSAIQ
ncbi:MAG TPA: hypothetical protein VF911_13055 [Thermoanaerobaculia bacterium]|jgi:hypothetical protein